MKRLIDFYLRFPIFYDILISVTVCILFDALDIRDKAPFSKRLINEDLVGGFASGFITFAGFVLTIITIIVSFKHTIPLESNKTKSRTYLFYNSDYYKVSLKLLTNCVLVLIVVFFALLFFYMFDQIGQRLQNYIYGICLILGITTIFRFVLILKVIKDFKVD